MLLFFSQSLYAQTNPESQSPSPELRRLDLEMPDLLIDMRYATSNNFTKKIIYPNGLAWLRPETIKRLRLAQKDLRRQGFQIVILDAYRPAWAQQKLWEAFPNSKFLASPKKGSRHTRGTTVDLTLATLSGRLVEMPSNFDEFTDRANHDFSDLPPLPRKHGIILRKAMFAAGFSGVPDEWWHYDITHWKKYPLIQENPKPQVP